MIATGECAVMRTRTAIVFLACLLAGGLVRAQDVQGLPISASLLMNRLPACSWIRSDLQDNFHGDGLEKPYMQPMRRAGIRHAYIELRATFATYTSPPANVHIVNRVYFTDYDGPAGSVIDPTMLADIKRDGAENILDQEALVEGVRSHMFPTKDDPPPELLNAKNFEAVAIAEFYSNPWIPNSRPYYRPLAFWKLSPLSWAAHEGDRATLAGLIARNHPSRQELDDALRTAAATLLSSAAVIRLLLEAGAGVNDPAPSDGSVPIMAAVSSPCNQIALIVGGADLNVRERDGKSALDLATQQDDKQAMLILEAAMAARRAWQPHH